MADLLFKEESYKIIGACFEVHNILGHGFKEAVYKDALELELIKLEIPFVRIRTPIRHSHQFRDAFFRIATGYLLNEH